MSEPQSLLGLDIGTVRIGVARASAIAKLPEPLGVVLVDGTEIQAIKKFIDAYNVDTIVVGLPLSLEGNDTQQTNTVRSFVKKLDVLGCEIIWQDERLSSVRAEEELKRRGGDFAKGDVDALAATYILDDYLNGV